MKVYVASKSGNPRFALEEDNVIAVVRVGYGPNPLGDAKSYAYDHTKATDESAFVFEADLVLLGSYKTMKEVVFVSTKP